MNVILVGYRGTGKSSVAGSLARQLGLQPVGLDAEIERRAGQPVPEIVRQRGWPGFRDLEEEVVRDFTSRDGQLLDCGGGVIEREANHRALRAAGTVVWLQASVDTIVARIGGGDQRPSLTGTKSFTDEVAEVLARRTPLYERISHIAVDTNGRDVEAIVSGILAALRQRSPRERPGFTPGQESPSS